MAQKPEVSSRAPVGHETTGSVQGTGSGSVEVNMATSTSAFTYNTPPGQPSTATVVTEYPLPGTTTDPTVPNDAPPPYPGPPITTAAPPYGHPNGPPLIGFNGTPGAGQTQAGLQPPMTHPITTTNTYTVVTRPDQCPKCLVGTIFLETSCLGIALAIVFFPMGLLCCLMLRQARCSHCGAYL